MQVNSNTFFMAQFWGLLKQQIYNTKIARTIRQITYFFVLTSRISIRIFT